MSNGVDILLPTFNVAPTLEESIESLQRQTVSNVRIIVIDAGSNDGTLEILARLAGKDDRIEVLIKPKSCIVEALNAGLDICTSEFIARQDADDISYPSRLEIERQFLQTHPSCLAVSGAARHIDEKGRPLGSVVRMPPPEQGDPFWAPSREPYLMHPFLMARRSALQAAGGYRYVYNSEDTDLYWRLLERGALHNIDHVLGDYRMHANSNSARSILNGRIMAMSSQLAALSARRRQAGREDIIFPKEMIAQYRAARTFAGLYELGSRQLDDAESIYLRVSMAAKLLELTAYRPYELDLDDCRFMRDARRELDALTPVNRRELDRFFAGAAARLAGKGLFREAGALIPPLLYFSAGSRWAFRALPESLRRFVAHRVARQRAALGGQ